MAFVPAAAFAVDAPPKSGTTSYTTHFVFVPKSTVDIPGVGKAVALEATGPTENTDGKPIPRQDERQVCGGQRRVEAVRSGLMVPAR